MNCLLPIYYHIHSVCQCIIQKAHKTTTSDLGIVNMRCSIRLLLLQFQTDQGENKGIKHCFPSSSQTKTQPGEKLADEIAWSNRLNVRASLTGASLKQKRNNRKKQSYVKLNQNKQSIRLHVTYRTYFKCATVLMKNLGNLRVPSRFKCKP